ncbi:MAG: Dna2/Cas4 domain-containing protein [Planctomycetaceae bacterium]
MSTQIPIENSTAGFAQQVSSADSLDQHDCSVGTLNFAEAGDNPEDAISVSLSEPPLRIESLHAMKYCERLFYFQEVEQISVAHPDVYAGRRLHDDVVPEDDVSPEKRSFQVSSEEWGLTGKADAVRKRDGQWIAYEHKKGRCRREADNSPAPWPSDRIQAIAYAVLIAEILDEPVFEARIRYHKDNVTAKVAIDDLARDDLRQAVERAREFEVPNSPLRHAQRTTLQHMLTCSGLSAGGGTQQARTDAAVSSSATWTDIARRFAKSSYRSQCQYDRGHG